VHPGTGDVWWLTMPTVNTEAFSIALSEFAAYTGAGPELRVVLVVDGAGWHVSKDLEVPEGIHLCFLPPYSPELQPAEHLWPMVNEELANRSFESLDELEEVALQRCRRLRNDPEAISNATMFHWWREIDAAP
jgi:hypothetical protein